LKQVTSKAGETKAPQPGRPGGAANVHDRRAKLSVDGLAKSKMAMALWQEAHGRFESASLIDTFGCEADKTIEKAYPHKKK
jgi:hypothetical protein